jgi:hypothetical protein
VILIHLPNALEHLPLDLVEQLLNTFRDSVDLKDSLFTNVMADSDDGSFRCVFGPKLDSKRKSTELIICELPARGVMRAGIALNTDFMVDKRLCDSLKSI